MGLSPQALGTRLQSGGGSGKPTCDDLEQPRPRPGCSTHSGGRRRPNAVTPAEFAWRSVSSLGRPLGH
jgi:hypothetical protein